VFDEPVVVHFLKGETLTGYGDNFLPGEAEIMVRDEGGAIRKVDLASVKVVCFVKSVSPDRAQTHRASPERLLYQAVPGRRVLLHFKDGERMEGLASISDKPRRGFFVTPLNPNSNNLQVYVNVEALLGLAFQGD
jgi:hypothetical protein